jgi:alkylation response protein AidB-like acyl-CoA dehydrogenase
VKHFGSGSGIASYMITAARAGEDEPDLFVIDMRDRPWDGSAGMTLLGEWDGHGMVATQSHSFRFEDCPAERIAWEGNLRALAVTAGPAINVLFAAVITGIMDAAMEVARRQLSTTHGSFRAYQQVAWSDIEQEAWLIERAYEGMVDAAEAAHPSAAREALIGRMAIARMAESALERMGTVIGGGTYQRRSPIGWWHQDVRALLFLRPPLPLAYDQLHALSWPVES